MYIDMLGKFKVQLVGDGGIFFNAFLVFVGCQYDICVCFFWGLTVDYIKNCSATSKYLFKTRSCCEDWLFKMYLCFERLFLKTITEKITPNHISSPVFLHQQYFQTPLMGTGIGWYLNHHSNTLEKLSNQRPSWWTKQKKHGKSVGPMRTQNLHF